MDFTAERLRELLHYDPETGKFTWRARPISEFADLRGCCSWNGRYAGKPAGSISKHIGYVQLLKGFAHRFAWVYVHGTWPVGEIDHINGERADNRLKNLRDVPPNINKQNIRRAEAKRSSLAQGVSHRPDNPSKPFTASVQLGGTKNHLGYFATEAEAHAAYLAEKRRIHEGCTI